MKLLGTAAKPCIVGVAGVCVIAFAASAREQETLGKHPPQPDASTLVTLCDPLADDWPSERLAAYAQRQLERLGDTLVAYAGGDDDLGPRINALFSAGDRQVKLPATHGDILNAGGLHVRRAIPTWTTTLSYDGPVIGHVRRDIPTSYDDPVIGLEALFRRFRGAADVHVSFTIVHIRRSDDDQFGTITHFEVSGRRDGGCVQQNGSCAINWKTNTGAERPLIRSISVGPLTEASADAPVFAECTTGVLGNADVWRNQVLRGGDHWYGKIDAMGELNYMGHQGIAVGDVNGDGLDDLYVAMGTGLPNLLYVQNADGSARERAEEAGVAWLDDTKGVLLVDFDNDGDQDLLCALGPTVVFCANDGSGRFTPVHRVRAVSDAAFYSLAAADYDLDGDLDVYACRYVMQRYGLSIPTPFHDANNGPPNHLLRNDGPAGFTDVTVKVGLDTNNRRFSLAAGWADYDQDGDPDLYVANDFGKNNLYRNDGGKFVDVAADTNTLDQAAGMGVSWSDFDLDGDLDLYVSNMFVPAGQRVTSEAQFMRDGSDTLRSEIRRHSMGNSLFVNSGDGTFTEATHLSNSQPAGWAWGAKFVDINNDALDDLIVPNGFQTGDREDSLDSFFWRHVASHASGDGVEKQPYIDGWVAMTEMMDSGASWSGGQRNRCFLNLGDGSFADVSAITGLDFIDDGRAVAVSDWDGDGRLDVWFRNRTGPQLRFLRNVGADDHHFVAFKLRGKTCNRDAIGASIEVRAGDRTILRTVAAGDGYLSQSSKWLHFGLGRAERIDSAAIHWPGGQMQALTDMAIDRRYRVEQGDAPTAEPPRQLKLAPSPVSAPTRASAARVVLRVPLPLPPSLTTRLFEGQSPRRTKLVALSSVAATTSVNERNQLTENVGRINAAGIDIVVLSLDEPPPPGRSTSATANAVEAVLHHVLHKPGDIVSPTYMLVDPSGALQVVYLNHVSVEQLLTDAATYGIGKIKAHRRSAFGGRWYYAMPRALRALARDLLDRGLKEDARHYVLLERRGRR